MIDEKTTATLEDLISSASLENSPLVTNFFAGQKSSSSSLKIDDMSPIVFSEEDEEKKEAGQVEYFFEKLEPDQKESVIKFSALLNELSIEAKNEILKRFASKANSPSMNRI